ncbi:MAG: hypothetical protein DWQ11_18850 [Proteobacteria bacterium]|nr:MAG: hypothetical protein DWQ11_18850 [Pseudomonadota bacterium]
MIETLLGTLFGGLFRLAPEALKWLDRKDERKHELAMFDKQLEADKLKGDQAIAQIDAQADATIGAAEIQAIIEATKAQAAQTGIRWVDAFNALMRPTITFWWVIVLYSVALWARFDVLVAGGQSNVQAILALWGTDEKAIVASIISFWFVDRSLRKMSGR